MLWNQVFSKLELDFVKTIIASDELGTFDVLACFLEVCINLSKASLNYAI